MTVFKKNHPQTPPQKYYFNLRKKISYFIQVAETKTKKHTLLSLGSDGLRIYIFMLLF